MIIWTGLHKQKSRGLWAAKGLETFTRYYGVDRNNKNNLGVFLRMFFNNLAERGGGNDFLLIKKGAF